VLVRLQCHHVEEERLIIASAAVAPIPDLGFVARLDGEGGGHMVLRNNGVNRKFRIACVWSLITRRKLP
jgi:hypothetical protein